MPSRSSGVATTSSTMLPPTRGPQVQQMVRTKQAAVEMTGAEAVGDFDQDRAGENHPFSDW